MRIGWIGFHQEGLPAFEAVLRQGYDVVALITLTESAAGKRCASGDYDSLCEEFGVPIHRVRHINDDSSLQILLDLQLDLGIVLGWCQILNPAALAMASLGMVGAHASLLPNNRGSAPVNWAIIKGETQTGNSLIWLADDVDGGQLIDQRQFDITNYDSCATIYDKVASSNRDMVLTLLPQLIAGTRPGVPQPEDGSELLPRRRPDDGLITWNQTNGRIYDFVRALTRPYPGAFSFLGQRKIKVWKAALLPTDTADGYLPGGVIGPVRSTEPEACGQLVACRDGSILLLEVEDEDGTILRGPELCEQPWQGKVFHHAA